MISAVICTANPRLDYLQRAVGSILAQDLDPKERELLIIDNASATPLAQLEFARGQALRVVREERVGLTAAKERATYEAHGDVVVFVDDDNVLASNYLSTVAKLFDDLHLGVVGPHVEPEYEVVPPQWFRTPHLEGSLVIRRLPNDRLYVSTVPQTGPYFPSGVVAVYGARYCWRTLGRSPSTHASRDALGRG